MPFDTTAKPDTETAALLRKAKALIDTPEKWCQGAMALDRLGRVCFDPMGSYVVRRCAIGAAATIDGCGWSRPLKAAAKEMGYRDPGDLNDRTDHLTVMRMFDRAIELAREEG